MPGRRWLPGTTARGKQRETLVDLRCMLRLDWDDAADLIGTTTATLKAAEMHEDDMPDGRTVGRWLRAYRAEASRRWVADYQKRMAR